MARCAPRRSRPRSSPPGLELGRASPCSPGGPTEGDQPLYTLTCRLLDAPEALIDETSARAWASSTWSGCPARARRRRPTRGSASVNGQPIFLQGVNWTPIRPNFADVTDADYRKRLELYRDLGCNLLRVWGGAFLEKECFYDLCDELGLLVWQEFPLSSSGMDNWPPEDASQHRRAVRDRRDPTSSAASITSRCCAGAAATSCRAASTGSKTGGGKPVDLSHPLIRRFAEIVAREDPGRRFLPTSSSGPRFSADPADYGKGLHWDVHGPWKAEGTSTDWTEYWSKDDALFRSETGSPGASPRRDHPRLQRRVCRRLPGQCRQPALAAHHLVDRVARVRAENRAASRKTWRSTSPGARTRQAKALVVVASQPASPSSRAAAA